MAQQLGVGHQALVRDYVERRQRRGAGHGVAAVRATVGTRRERRQQRAATHDARQRQARGDALGHDHDVGHSIGPLGGEEAAGAAVAGLDLVGDEQDAVLVGQFA